MDLKETDYYAGEIFQRCEQKKQLQGGMDRASRMVRIQAYRDWILQEKLWSHLGAIFQDLALQ